MAEQITASVHIVDDDPDVRETIAAMLGAAGFKTAEYAAALDLLAALDGLDPGCIITDVNMPGMNGLELVRHLKERSVDQPVLVISGEADIPTAVEAMKAGAAEFLEKPLHSERLREAVLSAIQPAAAKTMPSPETERYVKVVEGLTRRQREVLAGVVEGLPNKLIAYRLGLSIRTVEAYRAAIMDRTGCRNLSELVRLGIHAGI
jgi:two-component system response regulator FixJ